jgi:peptidoglycan/xylan/chitin deacetylase (PgdA/CDA1 family)
MIMAKEILCGFGIDVDAVAGWLGSYGGEDSPDDISRGLFAGEVGSPRLLKLFDRLGIKTTWFIPGHSIETFPEQMKAVAAAGHEIGIHGYSHENPIAMTRRQEEAVLDKCIDLPPMMFIKKAPNSHGFVNPRHLEEMWRDQFDWVYREYDYAVFPITIHPDVSGRPQVLLMLERLFNHMKSHPGVKFVTMDEMANDYAERVLYDKQAGVQER